MFVLVRAVIYAALFIGFVLIYLPARRKVKIKEDEGGAVPRSATDGYNHSCYGGTFIRCRLRRLVGACCDHPRKSPVRIELYFMKGGPPRWTGNLCRKKSMKAIRW